MSKDRLIVAEQQSLLVAEQQLVQSCLLVSFISSEWDWDLSKFYWKVTVNVL